jgi:SAM-dependent methyltransferase
MTEVKSTSWRSGATWDRVLSSLAIDPSASFHKSVYDPTIRTYLEGNLAHKITLKTDLPDLYPKISPGVFEAALLKRCAGIPGAPTVHGFRETTTACALSMHRLAGSALQDVIGDLTIAQASAIIMRLLRTTLGISWRGIAHNDIVPRNIVISEGSRPYLVDFDQAHPTSRTDALLRNVLGVRTNNPLLYGSWLLVAARLVFQFLPRRSAANMPTLAPDASPMQRKLFNAWKVAQRAGMKARGEPIADYSLVVEGMKLPGEQPWEQRWELLRGAADFTRLRTLDLGCNMGLLSTWLLKEGKASSALGVDSDPLILASAKQVAEAFSVGASFEKVDLDAEYPWERRFEPSDFDVIFVLNMLNLVQDKQRLMHFLGRFPLVVFEGHDPNAVEIQRFSAAGFPIHRILGTSDRGRTVFVFSKDPAQQARFAAHPGSG